MSQAGYTPIQLYFSTTAAAVPTNTNLANGELAINIQDEKLYFKNAAGTVKLLASNATSAPVLSFSAGTTGFTPNTATSGAITLAGTLATTNGGTGLTSFTSGGVVYASSSSALATGSALTFDGTNFATTGSATATRFIPSGSTVATNGMYLPAANSLGLSTNSTNAIYIDSGQRIGIGGSPSSGSTVWNIKSITGSTTSIAYDAVGTVMSDVTSSASGYRTSISTTASAFTLSTLNHFSANQSTIGASSAVTNQIGFNVGSSLIGATNNYGFYGAIASGTGRYNFYAAGTAQNYFNGATGFGITPPASPGVSQIFSNLDISMAGSSRGILGNLYYQAAWKFVADGYGWGINDSSGALTFNLAGLNASGAGAAATPVERMRIASTGNVGIGTTTTTNKLEIGGSGDSIMRLLAAGQANGLEMGQLTADGSSKIFVVNNNFLAVGTNNTERMRITSAGNVGIATTSPGSALDVKGTLRLSGATSGYVGLAPAAAAGSTTYTLPSADGSSGQFLSTNGSGTLSWATGGGGGGGTPGGSNTQVQYNSSGSFAGSANFTFNGTGITTGNVNVTSATNPTAGMYYNSTATSGLSFYNTGTLGGSSAVQIYYGRSSLAATTGGIDNSPVQWYGFGSGQTPQLTIGSTASIYYFQGHGYRLDSVPYVFTIRGGSRGDNGSYTVPESNGILYIDVAADYGGNGSTGRNCIYVKNDATGFGTSTNGVKVVNNFYGRQNAFYSLQKIGDPNGGGQNFGYYAQIDTSNGANDNAAPVGLVIDNALVDNYTKTNGNAQMAIFYDRRSGSTTRTAIQFYRNTTSNSVGLITTTNSATAYTTSSDYRLKENIAPLTGAIEKVLRLKPSTYNWKIDGSVGEGFIAHELQEVIPQAVSGEKDAEKLQQVEVEHAVSEVQDADGNIVSYGKAPVYEEKMMPVYQGVDTSFLVATLTAAIQEQQALIVALTARLEALEAK